MNVFVITQNRLNHLIGSLQANGERRIFFFIYKFKTKKTLKEHTHTKLQMRVFLRKENQIEINLIYTTFIITLVQTFQISHASFAAQASNILKME